MGLGAGLSAYTQERQKLKEQKYQDQLQQQYLALQNKNADLTAQQVQSGLATDATTRAVNEQKLAEAKRQADQDAKDQAFAAGLQLPKGWSNYDNDQKQAYLEVRLSKATAAGDESVIKATQAWLNSIPLGAQRLSTADYNAGARTDLAHAQIDLSHARVQQLKFQQGPAFAEKVREFNTSQGNRMATAGMAAGSRMQVAELYAAGRLQGLNQQQAQQQAIVQFQQANANYRAGVNSGAIDPTTTAAPVFQAPSYGAPIFNITVDPSGQTHVQPGGGGGGGPQPPNPVDVKLRSAGVDPRNPFVQKMVQALRAQHLDPTSPESIAGIKRRLSGPPQQQQAQPPPAGATPSWLQYAPPSPR